MPDQFPAISGVDDASQVRVMLLQSGKQVHAPVLNVGLQPLNANLTSWAAITRATGFDTFVATPSSANLAALVTDESGADKLLFGTPWAPYTPTFAGLGTPTAVFIESKRQGDDLLIRGKFTSGTSTAVEARMTLGFNGVNGGITSDAVKVPTIQLAGLGTYSVNAASTPTMLIESNVGYITFGLQSSTTNGMAKLLGTGFGSTVVMNFFATIPISGW